MIAVDPATGQQTAVSNNGISGADLVEDPFGIAVDPAGRILVADPRSGVGGDGAVIAVDPATGQQALVSDNDMSSANLFESPSGIALDSAGRILIADPSSDQIPGAVIDVDPATGQQTLVSDNDISGPDLFRDPVGIALDAAGRILVADPTSAADFTGAVVAVDPASRQQSLVASNGTSLLDSFRDPNGIAVVPPKCFGRFATIVGDSGKNVLRGTPGPDVIWGGGGKDKLVGRGGKDRICGEGGKDRLLGGKGRDLLNGGKGADRLFGGTGRDVLKGGKGPDRLAGGKGRDKLKGGKGADKEKS